jgi:hypothetical protein
VLTNAYLDGPAGSGCSLVVDRRRAQLHGTGVPAVRLLASAVDVRGGALPVAMPVTPAGVRQDQRTAWTATGLFATGLFATALITNPGTTLGNHSPGRPQS